MVKDPTRIVLTNLLTNIVKQVIIKYNPINIFWNKIKTTNEASKQLLYYTATGLSVTNLVCFGWEVKHICTHKVLKLLLSSSSADTVP